MFVLYAIPIGILVGYLLGGRLDRLTGLRLHWVPLILLGLALQIAIFTDAGGRLVGPAGPMLYIVSTAVVFVAVLRNIAVPGVVLVAIGAGCNLVAIVANGGWMPADPAALASVGGFGGGYTNSTIVVGDPWLRPLTDVFALPAWMPLANVFSIGDVLIGVGIAATIALAMRVRPTPPVAVADAVSAPAEGRPGGPGPTRGRGGGLGLAGRGLVADPVPPRRQGSTRGDESVVAADAVAASADGVVADAAVPPPAVGVDS